MTIEEAQHIVEERFGGESAGQHWTYAVMHSEYYNHYDFIYSLTSEQSKITDYAFKLAKGFLEDEDAPYYGKGKARKYFHFVI